MNTAKKIILCFILLLSLNLSAQTKDSTEVANATQRFLKSFTTFDWNTFKNCFADDATVFFPEEYRNRKNGRKEFEAVWIEIFPEFLDKTKKFDLDIKAKDIQIQVYQNSAVVTFEMGDEKNVSRRTLVFEKKDNDWKIVHLHASNLNDKK